MQPSPTNSPRGEPRGCFRPTGDVLAAGDGYVQRLLAPTGAPGTPEIGLQPEYEREGSVNRSKLLSTEPAG